MGVGRGEDSGPSGTRRAPVSQTRGWLREAGAPHPAWADVRGRPTREDGLGVCGQSRKRGAQGRRRGCRPRQTGGSVR